MRTRHRGDDVVLIVFWSWMVNVALWRFISDNERFQRKLLCYTCVQSSAIHTRPKHDSQLFIVFLFNLHWERWFWQYSVLAIHQHEHIGLQFLQNENKPGNTTTAFNISNYTQQLYYITTHSEHGPKHKPTWPHQWHMSMNTVFEQEDCNRFLAA